MAIVSITETASNLYESFVKATNDIGVRLISSGDRVLIKPNLVEPSAPNSGQITSPGVIEAVACYCLDYGATQVIIGEGPSYYQAQSQLRECFTRTGVSDVAKRLGIRWVVFDDYRYRTFKGVSDSTPDEFRVTEFAFTCDKFINLPVLKTHYLTTVTLAMKNLKGCLKREDKPLFHQQDLSRAVVELCKIIRPTINVIDCTSRAIVHQLGSGYAAGARKSGSGLLITSSDIVATDAVGCALMGIDPAEVRMVTLGDAAGLGESDLTRIDIVGEELKRLKFKARLPREQLQRSFPLLEIIGVEKACSGCVLPLVSSLSLLGEQGAKLEKPLAICLGKDPRLPRDKPYLLIGDCACLKEVGEANWLGGCPLSRDELLNRLVQYMAN